MGMTWAELLTEISKLPPERLQAEPVQIVELAPTDAVVNECKCVVAMATVGELAIAKCRSAIDNTRRPDDYVLLVDANMFSEDGEIAYELRPDGTDVPMFSREGPTRPEQQGDDRSSPYWEYYLRHVETGEMRGPYASVRAADEARDERLRDLYLIVSQKKPGEHSQPSAAADDDEGDQLAAPHVDWQNDDLFFTFEFEDETSEFDSHGKWNGVYYSRTHKCRVPKAFAQSAPLIDQFVNWMIDNHPDCRSFWVA